MTASELRELASAMNWHTSQTFTPSHKETFTQAAEVLELIAWAEGEQIEVHKTMNGVHVILGWGPLQFHGDTLIDTLRRAKEASRG